MDIMSNFYQTFWADDAYQIYGAKHREKQYPLKPEDEAKWWSVCEREDFEAFGRPLLGEIPKDDIEKGFWGEKKGKM
jgi:hypothetical protein